MKIAIDCSKAINEHAGIARYNYELARLLPKIGKSDEFFYYFNFIRHSNAKKRAINDLIGNAKNVSYRIIPLPGKIKEKLYPSRFSISRLFIPKCDLVHAIEFINFDKNLPMPQIVTVHDLAIVRFPKHRGEKESAVHARMLKEACINCTKIIAVSQSTKNDIIKYFHIDPQKIEVIYQATSSVFKPAINRRKITDDLAKLGIFKPYILFVGTIEPRKNVLNLIKAFEKVKLSRHAKQLKLVLVGKRGWNSQDIYDYAQKSPYNQDIKFLGFVPDAQMLSIYNQALLFCYPSLFEGFGIPVLEAQKCALPVITSNISSLPEVGGDAAIYINPNDFHNIAKNILLLIQNENIRKKMSFASLKQSAKFSWPICAKQTYDLYKKVINEKI